MKSLLLFTLLSLSIFGNEFLDLDQNQPIENGLSLDEINLYQDSGYEVCIFDRDNYLIDVQFIYGDEEFFLSGFIQADSLVLVSVDGSENAILIQGGNKVLDEELRLGIDPTGHYHGDSDLQLSCGRSIHPSRIKIAGIREG